MMADFKRGDLVHNLGLLSYDILVTGRGDEPHLFAGVVVRTASEKDIPVGQYSPRWIRDRFSLMEHASLVVEDL